MEPGAELAWGPVETCPSPRPASSASTRASRCCSPGRSGGDRRELWTVSLWRLDDPRRLRARWPRHRSARHRAACSPSSRASAGAPARCAREPPLAPRAPARGRHGRHGRLRGRRRSARHLRRRDARRARSSSIAATGCRPPPAATPSSSPRRTPGDTAEVLSAVEVALARRVPVVAITSGGALGALAAAHGLPARDAARRPHAAHGARLPRVPRAGGAGRVRRRRWRRTADVDEALAGGRRPRPPSWRPSDRPPTRTRPSAWRWRIGDRLPAVYGGPLTGAVAYRWKTDLEENAKALRAGRRRARR